MTALAVADNKTKTGSGPVHIVEHGAEAKQMLHSATFVLYSKSLPISLYDSSSVAVH